METFRFFFSVCEEQGVSPCVICWELQLPVERISRVRRTSLMEIGCCGPLLPCALQIIQGSKARSKLCALQRSNGWQGFSSIACLGPRHRSHLYTAQRWKKGPERHALHTCPQVTSGGRWKLGSTGPYNSGRSLVRLSVMQSTREQCFWSTRAKAWWECSNSPRVKLLWVQVWVWILFCLLALQTVWDSGIS